jgi:hypothetical protein
MTKNKTNMRNPIFTNKATSVVKHMGLLRYQSGDSKQKNKQKNKTNFVLADGYNNFKVSSDNSYLDGRGRARRGEDAGRTNK